MQSLKYLFMSISFTTVNICEYYTSTFSPESKEGMALIHHHYVVSSTSKDMYERLFQQVIISGIQIFVQQISQVVHT